MRQASAYKHTSNPADLGSELWCLLQDAVLRQWCWAVLQAFGDSPGLVSALDRQLRLGPGSSWSQLFGEASAAEALATQPGLASQQRLQVSATLHERGAD